MRTRTLILSLLLAVISIYSAAQTTHGTDLLWIDSPDKASNPALAYKLFSAPGKCPATGIPTGATPTPASTNSFSDSNVKAATTKCYYVTATLNGSESVPSGTSEATTPIFSATAPIILNRVLSWTASADAQANAALAYNVRKGAGDCSSNPTLTLVSSKQTTLTFSDDAAPIGSVNCYAITATLNNSESPSVSISGTIPIAPVTGITITVH